MHNLQTLGPNGEVFLDAAHAGRSVAVDELEPGVWRVTLDPPIPDRERSLDEPEAQGNRNEALASGAAESPDKHPGEIKAALPLR